MLSRMLCSPARLFPRSRYTPVFLVECRPLAPSLNPPVVLFAQPCGKKAASGCHLLSRLCCHHISTTDRGCNIKNYSKNQAVYVEESCRKTHYLSYGCGTSTSRKSTNGQYKFKFLSHPAADSDFLRIPTVTTKVIIMMARSTEIAATTLPFSRLRLHFSQ